MKVSSSTRRQELLGTLLRPRRSESRRRGQDGPYVVGLTGSIASGKSSAAQYLGSLGAVVIDADKLGHRAYLKGSDCFQALVKEFGEAIVSPETGEIDRRTLGRLVFANGSARLPRLNSIVWPAIARLAEEDLMKVPPTSIVVLEAAVLLEAGWDQLVDEVWTLIIPRDTALARIR